MTVQYFPFIMLPLIKYCLIPFLMESYWCPLGNFLLLFTGAYTWEVKYKKLNQNSQI